MMDWGFLTVMWVVFIQAWFNSIKSRSVDEYGLDLTVVVNPVTTYTQFLDIQFKFCSGELTTDIFRKETDANRYLSFL